MTLGTPTKTPSKSKKPPTKPGNGQQGQSTENRTKSLRRRVKNKSIGILSENPAERRASAKRIVEKLTTLNKPPAILTDVLKDSTCVMWLISSILAYSQEL